jgi:hypothetical protein
MVLLPPEWEGLRLIDIYSGAAPEIRLGPEGPRIAVADLFRYFPFAMAGNAPWRERREVPL